MAYLVFKYISTALIIVLVSEAAKRSDKVGAVISSLPMVTVLTLIWLFIEGQSEDKIKNHAYYTFWYVIPTLPMFLIFPKIYDKYGFWQTLLISTFLTCIIFIVFAIILKKFGIELL